MNDTLYIVSKRCLKSIGILNYYGGLEYFGLSEVCEVGHFLVNFPLNLTLLATLTKIPEGVVIGFRNFACAPN